MVKMYCGTSVANQEVHFDLLFSYFRRYSHVRLLIECSKLTNYDGNMSVHN